jgi:hypothetical protein
VEEEPVVCFALLDPPYAEREDGPPQPVVPMIRSTGYYGGDILRGMFELVIGDEAYWKNQDEDMGKTFVGYLSPGEDPTTPWVQARIAEIIKILLTD